MGAQRGERDGSEEDVQYTMREETSRSAFRNFRLRDRIAIIIGDQGETQSLRRGGKASLLDSFRLLFEMKTLPSASKRGRIRPPKTLHITGE